MTKKKDFTEEANRIKAEVGVDKPPTIHDGAVTSSGWIPRDMDLEEWDAIHLTQIAGDEDGVNQAVIKKHISRERTRAGAIKRKWQMTTTLATMFVDRFNAAMASAVNVEVWQDVCRIAKGVLVKIYNDPDLHKQLPTKDAEFLNQVTRWRDLDRIRRMLVSHFPELEEQLNALPCKTVERPSD